MSKKNEKLTPNQKIFADRWLIHRNGTRAYREAYGINNDNVACAAGSRTLSLVKVQTYIQEKLSEIEKRFDIDLDQCIRGLARIAKANMMDYVSPGGTTIDLSKLDHDQASAIEEIVVEEYTERTGRGDETENVKRTKIKLYDKQKALVDLGKHFGGFKNTHKHEGTLTLEQLLSKSSEENKDAK